MRVEKWADDPVVRELEFPDVRAVHLKGPNDGMVPDEITIEKSGDRFHIHRGGQGLTVASTAEQAVQTARSSFFGAVE